MTAFQSAPLMNPILCLPAGYQPNITLWESVVAFDPGPLYELLKDTLDPKQRIQVGLSMASMSEARLFLDHIVPVKFGGGASWLGDYQLLCGPCHRIKTNADFGWKKPRPTTPLFDLNF